MLPCSDGDRLLIAEKLNHETEVINKVIFNKANEAGMQKSQQGAAS